MCPHRLVSVHLAGEVNVDEDATRHAVLGVLRLPSDVPLTEVRRQIATELPSYQLDFVFLTQDRCPVWKHQEANLTLNHVLGDASALFIARHFEERRIGVKKHLGPVVGFVFAGGNTTLEKLRSCINDQLLIGNFVFQDRNGWPVRTSQERTLAAWDVVSRGVVTLRLSATSLERNRAARKRKKNSTGFMNKQECSKDIVISYARSEADEHAKKLKLELEGLGAKVFLDQDDIVPGDDWQNKLNDAIQNCTIFVPLVTARYGNTTYTNKEVKLADYIGKFVIPVNFLKTWPPNHLAIQFASIQYIEWRKAEEVQHGPKETDTEEAEEAVRIWEASSVERVANDIYEILVQCKKEQAPGLVVAAADSGTSPICPAVRPFVVISTHPLDREFGAKIQNLLERNCYKAWCSTDVSWAQGASSPSSTGTTPSTPVATPVFSSLDSVGYHDSFPPPSAPPILHRTPSFQFSCSMDATDSDSSLLKSCSKKNEFKRKAQQAEVVIIILTDNYIASRASQQQAFYCLLRKKVVVISCTDKELPMSLQKRVQFASAVMKGDLSGLESRLAEQVQQVLQQSEKKVFDPVPEEANNLTSRLGNELPASDFKVYVTGSTQLSSKKSENICRAIGQELASLKFVSLCTCGYLGVEDLTAKSFCEERSLTEKSSPRVFHVVPERDKQDWRGKAYVKADGSFGGIPYGQVKTAGNSVAERDTAIARIFQVCILIEGGESTARRAEEFVWNDKPVIPVFCTGGAAGGVLKSGTDSGHLRSIYENPPPGVERSTWCLLKNSSARAEDIGRAVKAIVTSLYRHSRKRPTKLPERLKVSRPS